MGTDIGRVLLQLAPGPVALVGFAARRKIVNPLVVLIRSQPGMAERLLAEHADDGSGRCRLCSSGAQAGRYRFPCAIQRAATEANAADAVGNNTMIGSGR